MMARLGAFGLMLAAATACGCAGAPVEHLPSLVSDQQPAAGAPAPAAGYQLSEQELKYSCKELTGIMQVRILQIRDYDSSKNASAVARGFQSFATPIWGGTTAGIDPDGQYRKDRAMLEAYNQRLAAKKCKTFDLAAEFKGAKPDEIPQPTGKKPAVP
jgi:hypothetical protein